MKKESIKTDSTEHTISGSKCVRVYSPKNEDPESPEIETKFTPLQKHQPVTDHARKMIALAGPNTDDKSVATIIARAKKIDDRRTIDIDQVNNKKRMFPPGTARDRIIKILEDKLKKSINEK